MARTLASAYAVAGLLLAACSTAPAIDSTPGQPILCGDFVDANGAPLANCSFGVNLRFENGVVGGWGGISDQNGEFRIDTGLGCLRRAEDSERILLLVGEGDLEARIDVRRAFGPGVHHLGEVVLADPCDARALRRMSDAALVVALEQRRTIAERELDACLRECARRRTAAVREFLANDAMRQLIPPTVWRTAACRAAGLRDPLALEVSPSGEPRELRCRMGQLPAVELHFVNRDPDGRSLDLRVFENLGGDLAVECTGEATERRAVRLVPRRREGGFYGLLTWSLAPGGAATVPARLGDFVEIAAPGTYHLRFVFREDGDDFVDAERNELRNGFLFLCSDPFTLIVEP